MSTAMLHHTRHEKSQAHEIPWHFFYCNSSITSKKQSNKYTQKTKYKNVEVTKKKKKKKNSNTLILETKRGAVYSMSTREGISKITIFTKGRRR